MADERQLWEKMGPGILAYPDNDNLRLEFAEELEADGSPESSERARFIYAQLALSTISPGHSEWMHLATESESLLLDNNDRWVPSWYREYGIRDAEFHRGFIECLTISGNTLLKMRDQLFRQSPIRHLDLVDFGNPNLLGDILGALESDGYLQQIVSLRLDGQGLEDRHVKSLNRKSLSNCDGFRWQKMKLTMKVLSPSRGST